MQFAKGLRHAGKEAAVHFAEFREYLPVQPGRIPGLGLGEVSDLLERLFQDKADSGTMRSSEAPEKPSRRKVSLTVARIPAAVSASVPSKSKIMQSNLFIS